MATGANGRLRVLAVALVKRHMLSSAIGVAMLFVCSRLGATPAARLVYLRGKGTETCPSEGDVRDAVQARLGYDPFSVQAPSTMFVDMTAVNGGFAASLRLVDGSNGVRGDRVL